MDKAKVRVTIRIEMDEQSKATSMLESLLPDNVDIPEGLSVDFHVDERILVLVFEALLDVTDGEGSSSNSASSSRRMASLIHTIDEVLDHVNTMARVMNVGINE
ncbi:MAG: KEOPS complex subunit Pcc1 [Candidatus Nitrosocaldus sp.]